MTDSSFATSEGTLTPMTDALVERIKKSLAGQAPAYVKGLIDHARHMERRGQAFKESMLSYEQAARAEKERADNLEAAVVRRYGNLPDALKALGAESAVSETGRLSWQAEAYIVLGELRDQMPQEHVDAIRAFIGPIPEHHNG